jgi:hypothetical protein
MPELTRTMPLLPVLLVLAVAAGACSFGPPDNDVARYVVAIDKIADDWGKTRRMP